MVAMPAEGPPRDRDFLPLRRSGSTAYAMQAMLGTLCTNVGSELAADPLDFSVIAACGV